MVMDNRAPEMIPSHPWPPATFQIPPRQSQSDFDHSLPPHAPTMAHRAPGIQGHTAADHAAGTRRRSLAATTVSSTPTGSSAASPEGEEHSNRLHPGGNGRSFSPGPSTRATQASLSSQKPIRRRMRMITSCLECRRRKLKCEKKHPCHNCKRFQRECVYLGPNLDEASQQRLTEIKEKVGSLERQLERDVAKGASTRRSGSPTDGADPFNSQRFVADDVGDGHGEQGDLQMTPMVHLDLTYDDYSDGNGADDLIDLGVRVGKMRITERIGGFNRPRISEEIQAGIADTQNQLYASHNPFGGPDEPHDAFELPDFLKPGDSYLAPTSGFFFGQFTESPSLITLLPPVELGHRLMRHYLDAVHPIVRCVHRFSFEATYALFWEEVRQNIEPRPSVQAIVFAAWFSAAVSLDDGFCQTLDCSKPRLVLQMKIGTETALSKARFLSTTRFETLQAMVWHQLCFLDVRTCEAQGPKPAIRREDYDTKMPLNCEEDRLTPQSAVWPAPAESWTSMLLPIIRFEINEMMRNIWTDRRKLLMRKTTLTAMITRVETFRKRMLEKYNRMLDDQVPIQKYAKLVMELLIYRLHVMVLHPYHSNTAESLPEKLKGLLVTSGIMIIEIAIRLESNPMFRSWAWYQGAYQQYHIALLLATEVYYRPNDRAAERIWPCLDWVFQLDPNTPRVQKSLQILTEIMSKTNVYMNLRRVRAPTTLSMAVPGKQAVKESPPPPPPPTPPDNIPRPGPQQHIQHAPPPFQQPPAPLPPGAPFHPACPGPIPGLKTEHMACSTPLASTAPLIPHSQSLPGPVHNTFAPPIPPLPPSSLPLGMMVSSPQGQHPHQQQHPQHQPQNLVFPPHPMLFTPGVAPGEGFWGLPSRGSGSPENSSDGGSVVGQPQRHGSFAGLPSSSASSGMMNVMQDLDWVRRIFLFLPPLFVSNLPPSSSLSFPNDIAWMCEANSFLRSFSRTPCMSCSLRIRRQVNSALTHLLRKGWGRLVGRRGEGVCRRQDSQGFACVLGNSLLLRGWFFFGRGG
ncbi:uncharacterized protein C8A04DRAFT_13290 [Dichotomopilus funicola]|uniref:Zn(2)-C6 fungal-type domain-containing protein n=1 Tax=Dichotomopilus funicola TaxID=1934379 RepID=A0AAN6UZY4_9PEZI|nr:hypothetical protein C8A04DRAFT_13290 [Dichotomopilus funicola]